jgi:hypothetical protein
MLFQSLATAAGYDPVHGPGSSCLDAAASGKCVLPWGSGTKAVSSVVLIANGTSFAVCHCLSPWPIALSAFQVMTMIFRPLAPRLTTGTLAGGCFC